MTFKETVYLVVSATIRGAITTFQDFANKMDVSYGVISISKHDRKAVLSHNRVIKFISMTEYELYYKHLTGHTNIEIMSDRHFETDFVPKLMKLQEEGDENDPTAV